MPTSPVPGADPRCSKQRASQPPWALDRRSGYRDQITKRMQCQPPGSGMGPRSEHSTSNLRSKSRRRLPTRDRKSVVEGKSVSVRVDLGGRRIIKTKKHIIITTTKTKIKK